MGNYYPKRVARHLVLKTELLANMLYGRLRAGASRPVPGELVYIPTREITQFVIGANGSRKRTGYLTSRKWQPQCAPIESFPKIAFCIAHFEKGIPWSKTGAYERMLEKIRQKGAMDGCKTFDDVVLRYSRVDEMFEDVKEKGKLDAAGPTGSTEHMRNGILVHIDQNGHPIFGLGGCHRFATAKILKLSEIPALIGFVHPNGLSTLERYRTVTMLR